MSGRGRQSIDYVKPSEPSFLTKFKQQAGYKEGPNVDTKVIIKLTTSIELNDMMK